MRNPNPNPKTWIQVLDLVALLLILVIAAAVLWSSAAAPAHGAEAETETSAPRVKVSASWAGNGVLQATISAPRHPGVLYIGIYRQKPGSGGYSPVSDPGTSPVGYIWEHGNLYRYTVGGLGNIAELIEQVQGPAVTVRFSQVSEACSGGGCLVVAIWGSTSETYARAAVPALP